MERVTWYLSDAAIKVERVIRSIVKEASIEWVAVNVSMKAW
jgi:hypothetical protein